MKITIFLLLTLGTAAFAQNAGVLSNQPQLVIMPSHPLHAEPHALATEQLLVGGGENTYTYAQGERPLSDFGSPLPEPTPLGDVARAFRKQKQAARKAEVVLEKQGS